MFSKIAAQFLLCLVGFVSLTTIAGADDSTKPREKKPRRPGIVATAASAGTFRTLVNALVAADLVDALKENGPFTVLAPSDEAFSQIPAEDLASLLKPENKEALRKILSLHVIPGLFTAEVLASQGSPKTLNGAKLTVASNSHGLAINEATVVKADILCGNGIIHVIDRVLLPTASTTDILGVAESKKSFKILLAALKATGLDEGLRGDGPYTVLAPTDEAFGKIPKEKLEALLKPENKAKLAEILTYHVITGRLSARELVSAGKAKTKQGGSVSVSIEYGRLVVNESKVIWSDIKADNGIIHAIDSVLVPE